MTGSKQDKYPDFFENHDLDPVKAATKQPLAAKPIRKKKAGFYLSEALLERFNRLFHQLKLKGAAIENKSALLELSLSFALDDLEMGDRGQLFKSLK